MKLTNVPTQRENRVDLTKILTIMPMFTMSHITHMKDILPQIITTDKAINADIKRDHNQ